MANVASNTIPTSKERITSPVASDLRQLSIQVNNLIADFAAATLVAVNDGVISGCTLSTGTTNTLATAAGVITIAGTPAAYSALTAQAFGALGTIPALKWGIIGVDAVAAGTTTFVSGAANYTTGYATEALAIAAFPAKTSAKARLGFVTIQASASTWVAGTDGLKLGSGGNVAAATSFYTFRNPLDLTVASANELALGIRGFTSSQIATLGNTVLTSANY